MQNELIRVLIVDDHRVVRQGLRDFLELHAAIEVVVRKVLRWCASLCRMWC